VITQPVIIELRDWADQIILDLDNYGPLARLENEGDWRQWGLQFCVISGLSQKNIPNPFFFDDWRSWAERFVQMVD